MFVLFIYPVLIKIITYMQVIRKGLMCFKVIQR
jgi:hypothetical protein